MMNREKPIGITIAQIKQLQGRICQKLLKNYPTISGVDVNEAQTKILFHLWQNDGVSISHIAQSTSLANTTLTNMLDRLMRQGLITKVRNDNNKREYIISLTDKCRQMYAEYVELEKEMRDINLRGFSREEIDLMTEYLIRMKNNLRSWEEENKA